MSGYTLKDKFKLKTKDSVLTLDITYFEDKIRQVYLSLVICNEDIQILEYLIQKSSWIRYSI